jgi:hypothetical protein
VKSEERGSQRKTLRRLHGCRVIASSTVARGSPTTACVLSAKNFVHAQEERNILRETRTDTVARLHDCSCVDSRGGLI